MLKSIKRGRFKVKNNFLCSLKVRIYSRMRAELSISCELMCSAHAPFKTPSKTHSALTQLSAAAAAAAASALNYNRGGGLIKPRDLFDSLLQFDLNYKSELL